MAGQVPVGPLTPLQLPPRPPTLPLSAQTLLGQQSGQDAAIIQLADWITEFERVMQGAWTQQLNVYLMKVQVALLSADARLKALEPPP